MVRIITDSAADFEPQELSQLNIFCIPLSVRFLDDEYQENINLSKDQFYSLLEETKCFPKTSQAAPQVLLDFIAEAQEAGDEAVYITLSSKLSGTYQSAVMAKSISEYANFYPVDSLNATGGQRILVEYACKLRDEGKDAAQIVAAVEALRGRIVLYACMDTLEYLHLGGRISQTVYKLGSLANIKPLIRVAEGAIEVPAKAMGMRKGMDILCKRLELQQPDPNFPLYAMYTGNRTVAQTLAARFETVGHPVSEERIINVGAAIGAHVGPNACGMVYVEAE